MVHDYIYFLLDVDECIEANNPCPDPSTICVNMEGAYECVKTSASPFPLPSVDKNPSDHQKNMQSGLQVTCSAGYKLSNDSGITRCIDVDECKERLHSCELDERCTNEIGSYRYNILRYFNDINSMEDINRLF